MKKALSVLLSVLVVLSMFSVMAFAAEEPPITILFVDYNGEVLQELKVSDGTILTQLAPANPERPDDEGKTEYIFKGWKSSEDGEIYYQSSLPVAKLAEGETSKTVTYTAEYSERDISGYQSFWNLIESIFERLNMIFEYFARIFEF